MCEFSLMGGINTGPPSGSKKTNAVTVERQSMENSMKTDRLM